MNHSRRRILLVDNGSTRPDATLSLRRIAESLAARIGGPVYPVSLQHADRIPPEELEGRGADVLPAFLRAQRAQGVEEFVLVPLFFGASRALSGFVPDTVREIGTETGAFRLRVARPLCPLPAGEARLARILCDNAARAAAAHGLAPKTIVLVDHGSPVPRVTAVRRRLAEQMRDCLPAGVVLEQAVMERRPGPEYDFNGPLLEDLLVRLAREDARRQVVVAMLFFSPGRHAGPGGDIEAICNRVEEGFPGFRAQPSPLIGEHEGLAEILASRLMAEEQRLPCRGCTSDCGNFTSCQGHPWRQRG